MSREIRVSPDGDAVAIRTDNPEDGRRAWGVIHVHNGSAWSPASVVDGWEDITPAE